MYIYFLKKKKIKQSWKMNEVKIPLRQALLVPFIVHMYNLLKSHGCRSGEELLLFGLCWGLIKAEVTLMLLSHLVLSLWTLRLKWPVIMSSCCRPYIGPNTHFQSLSKWDQLFCGHFNFSTLVLFKSVQFVLKQCFDPWFYQVQLFCVSNFLIPQRFVFILGQLLFSSASS